MKKLTTVNMQDPTKITVPQNARIIYDGEWRCNKGFKQQGNRCLRVNVPQNARIIYDDEWRCNKGFKQQGNRCL